MFKQDVFELKYAHTPMPNQPLKTETLIKPKIEPSQKFQSRFDEADDDGNKSEEERERRLKELHEQVVSVLIFMF